MKRIFKHLLFLAICIVLSLAMEKYVDVTFSEVVSFIDKKFNYHPIAFFSIMFAYMITLIAPGVLLIYWLRKKLNILNEPE